MHGVCPVEKWLFIQACCQLAQNEAALAIVLGHEITHAVAHHGQERISQALLAQGIGIGGDVFTSGNSQANNIFNSIYAPAPRLAFYCPIQVTRNWKQIIMGLFSLLWLVIIQVKQFLSGQEWPN